MGRVADVEVGEGTLCEVPTLDSETPAAVTFDINLVTAIRRFWCLKVGERSGGGVNPWLSGTNCNTELGKSLKRAALPSSDPPKRLSR